jgi:hypothetical protein
MSAILGKAKPDTENVSGLNINIISGHEFQSELDTKIY